MTPVTAAPRSSPFDAIAFDADDTLWHNEDSFTDTENEFVELLAPFAAAADARQVLFDTETRNLEVFGYGVKSYTLSMIEAAMDLSAGAVSSTTLARLLELGKNMLSRPAALLPDVANVVEELHRNGHRLVVITKGDLHHQERKVQGSGIAHLFEAIEVVSEKNADTYRKIADRHRIDPTRLVMIGNSVRSDILPIIELGGIGVHIPYVVTWALEHVDPDHLHAYKRNSDGARYWELATIREVPALLDRLAVSLG
jgi:putative hydrolase of the HAD superfamily